MLIEIGLIYWFMEFVKSHEWQQRPLNYDYGAEKLGKIIPKARHDQGFYYDGSNSGYFKDGGVRADEEKYLNRYGKYKPLQGEMCRQDRFMRQAEADVASKYKDKNYNSLFHNCHDYKEAVNKRYEELVKQNGGLKR